MRAIALARGLAPRLSWREKTSGRDQKDFLTSDRFLRIIRIIEQEVKSLHKTARNARPYRYSGIS